MRYAIQVGPVMIPTGVDKDGDALYTVVMEPVLEFTDAKTIEHSKGNGTEMITLKDKHGHVMFTAPLHMILYVKADPPDTDCAVVPIRPQLVEDMGEQGTDLTH